MHRKILETIREFIREHGMLVPGDRVIIGLSGGADSVSLLMILSELKKELNIELFAVHVHHGLRGKEADRDSAYAQELSENLGVPFVCVHADVAEYARVNGVSEEEAGRHLRYRILEEQRLIRHAAKIAVAHHADDQVETVLYNLFRGSGLKGIGGMRPVRDSVIRPLLSVTRKEILAYLEEKEISYCEDSTNSGTDYIRNRLRHEIIPAVRERINEGASSNILQAAKTAAAADAYFERAARRILESGGIRERREDGGVISIGISAEILKQEESIVRQYVIRQMIGEMYLSLKDIASVHVEEAEKLLFKPVGRRIQLPDGGYALRTYDELWIKKRKKAFSQSGGEETGITPVMTTFPYKKGRKFPKTGIRNGLIMIKSIVRSL